MSKKPIHNTRLCALAADVHLAGFAPVFTLSFHDSECSRSKQLFYFKRYFYLKSTSSTDTPVIVFSPVIGEINRVVESLRTAT